MLWNITYLSGALWAYHNMPHSSNGEKASLLLFGFDCCHITEAVVLPIKSLNAAKAIDYRKKLILSLPSVKALIVKSIFKAQQNQKDQYDRHTNSG